MVKYAFTNGLGNDTELLTISGHRFHPVLERYSLHYLKYHIWYIYRNLQFLGKAVFLYFAPLGKLVLFSNLHVDILSSYMHIIEIGEQYQCDENCE